MARRSTAGTRHRSGRRRAALCAVVGGLIALTSVMRAQAQPPPVQPFPYPFPTAAANVTFCYDGAPPSGGSLDCGPGSSSTSVAAGTTVTVYEIIDVPLGTRMAGPPMTFTPDEWMDPSLSLSCTPDGNGACTDGSVAGAYTARVDVGCLGLHSVIADPSSPPSTPSTPWPDVPSWVALPMLRAAASFAGGGSGEPTGGPDAFVPLVNPLPSVGPWSFTFSTLDSINVASVRLGGASTFNLTLPLRVERATYDSPYWAGLRVTATSTGIDALEPPRDDQFECLDSPQQSITTTSITTPSTPGIYPRWTTFESLPDLRSGEVTRMIDVQCVVVGSPSYTDADGDCLPAVTDPNDGLPDIDGDYLLDGVEWAAGSSPTVADVDFDGADDFAEMFQFTNPAAADTDGDGSLDKQDTGADEATGTPAIDDTTQDDNCPSEFNPAQTNTDALNESHGNGTGSGDTGGSSVPASPNMGGTLPDKDYKGDACDLDDDNDDLLDVVEVSMTIVPWSGYTGTERTVCRRAAVGNPPVAMSTIDGDSDNDLILDGTECRMRSRPDVASLSVASCSTAPVDADGCARPGAAISGGDADGDRLYIPGENAGWADTVETLYRTRRINQTGGPQLDDIESCPAGLCVAAACGPDGLIGNADADSDCDGLRDGAEVQFYGTSPANPDTDSDGCSDGQEVADINGDRTVNAIDVLLVSAANVQGLYFNGDGTLNTFLTPSPLERSVRDVDKNRTVNASDVSFIQAMIGACGAVVGTPMATVTSAIHDASHVSITGSTVAVGTVVHSNAVVSGTGATPTGTVDFLRYTTSDCTGAPTTQNVPLVSGAAESPPYTTALGVMSYRVNYNPAGTYPAAVGPCDSLTVVGSLDVTGTWSLTFLGGSCNLNFDQPSPTTITVTGACDIADAVSSTVPLDPVTRTFNLTGSNPVCGAMAATITFDVSAMTFTGNGSCANLGSSPLTGTRDCTTLPCPTLILSPLYESKPTGSSQSVIGTVGLSGAPVSGAAVVFSVVNGPNTTAAPASKLTNASGNTTAYMYTASNTPGRDRITATVSVNGKPAIGRAIRLLHGLALSPAGGGDFVGPQHTVTASVQNGSAPSVTFTVTGANSAGPANVPVSGGTAQFNYTGAFEGADVITATATVDGSPVVATAAMSWAVDGGGKIFPVAGGTVGDGATPLAAALASPYALALDAQGRAYVADAAQHRVRRITPGLDGVVDGSSDETVATIAGTGVAGYSGDGGPATAAMLNGPAGVAVDAAGNVYISDTNNARVRKVSTGGTITTIAGTGVAGHNGESGTATAMKLHEPQGLALDGAGNLYIADRCNHRVRRLAAPAMTSMATLAGTGPFGCGGTGELLGDGGPAVSARLNRPTGVAVDGNTLLIADSCNHRVRSVDLVSGTMNTFAGSGVPGFGDFACTSGGFAGDSGAATSAALDMPQSITVIGSTAYIADTGNHVVRGVTGGTITTAAGAGDVPGYADGSASAARFDAPAAAGDGGGGGLLVADTSNHRLRRLASGQVSTAAGTGQTKYCGDLFVAVASSCLNAPEGVAIDAAGNLYIADTQNQRVRFVAVANGSIRTVAGNGTAGFCGDGGTAASGCLNQPADVVVGADGALYISDRLNQRIRKVAPDGDGIVDGDAGEIITTLTGDGTAGVNDGALASGRVNAPRGLAIGGGFVYVADTGNCRVRRIDTGAATIATVAGTGSCGYSGEGAGTSVQLNAPRDVAVAPADGSVYIADTTNCRVRRLAGGTLSTVAGGACGSGGDGGVATAAGLNAPAGLTFSSHGGLVIADQANHRLRSVAAGADGIVTGGAGEVITTIAGTGTAGFCGDPDPAAHYATTACLNAPAGLAHRGSDDDLYLVDGGNDRVRKIQADCDLDGLIDSQEIGLPNDTEPCNADSDGDGHRDPQSVSHALANGDPNSDNCPSIPNSQLNSDGNFIDQSPPYVVDDRTVTRSDALGDDCDSDDDNDGLSDTAETAGPPCGSATAATNTLLLDTDGDRVVDGAECAMGSDPANAASKPAFPAPGTDPDSDRLSTAFEATIGTNPNDVDSDDDGVQDGWEYKGYNSNPVALDTDDDVVKDGCEVASVNGDAFVNGGDQAIVASEILRVSPPAKLANFDFNKDGVINGGDQAFQASMVLPGKCP